MKRLVLIEWIIIIIALLSLWPVVMGLQALWYYLYLSVVVVALLWVTRNRINRTRDAAKEAKRLHDEATKNLPRT